MSQSRARDVLLDSENIGQLAVVIFRPDMGAVAGIDELRCDPYPFACCAHRALDQMRGVQLLADTLNIAVLPLELERRCARNDAQVWHPSQCACDLFGDPV